VSMKSVVGSYSCGIFVEKHDYSILWGEKQFISERGLVTSIAQSD
jgi:hypothetical protein